MEHFSFLLINQLSLYYRFVLTSSKLNRDIQTPLSSTKRTQKNSFYMTMKLYEIN